MATLLIFEIPNIERELYLHKIWCENLIFRRSRVLCSFCPRRNQKTYQGSTLSFLAGCPKSHFLGWYINFLVYWYLKLDNQVVNSTCPKDKLGWIWQADDPWCRTLRMNKPKKCSRDSAPRPAPVWTVSRMRIPQCGPARTPPAPVWSALYLDHMNP